MMHRQTTGGGDPATGREEVVRGKDLRRRLARPDLWPCSGGAGPARAMTAVTTSASKTTVPRPSVAARVARVFYAGLSWAFVVGVVVQVFFAGMGAFGADWGRHTTFVHFLEPLPLLMVPVAFVGRMPWGLRLLPFGLTFLVGLQYAFASSVVPAAALHPVNALLILLLGIAIARRAWSSASGRKKGCPPR